MKTILPSIDQIQKHFNLESTENISDLIISLQDTIHDLKNEISESRKKNTNLSLDIDKLKAENDEKVKDLQSLLMLTNEKLKILEDKNDELLTNQTPAHVVHSETTAMKDGNRSSLIKSTVQDISNNAPLKISTLNLIAKRQSAKQQVR